MASNCRGCWTPVKSPKGVKDFEKYYITKEVKKVVKKVGEGEEDFVVVDKIIEHKDLIKGVIDSHASEVGVYNLIERVIRTGDASLLDAAGVKTDVDGVIDITKAPTEMADVLHFAELMNNAYNSLPEEVKKGRTLQEFAKASSATTSEDFAAWVASLQAPAVNEVKEDAE